MSNAPRVTPEHIESIIVDEYYFTAGNGIDGAIIKITGEEASVHVTPHVHPSLDLLTFCVLVLENGFTVTGESACVSPENFDAQIGREIARENAINKIWMLEGYLLKQQLHKEKQDNDLVAGLSDDDCEGCKI